MAVISLRGEGKTLILSLGELEYEVVMTPEEARITAKAIREMVGLVKEGVKSHHLMVKS